MSKWQQQKGKVINTTGISNGKAIGLTIVQYISAMQTGVESLVRYIAVPKTADKIADAPHFIQQTVLLTLNWGISEVKNIEKIVSGPNSVVKLDKLKK